MPLRRGVVRRATSCLRSRSHPGPERRIRSGKQRVRLVVSVADLRSERPYRKQTHQDARIISSTCLLREAPTPRCDAWLLRAAGPHGPGRVPPDQPTFDSLSRSSFLIPGRPLVRRTIVLRSPATPFESFAPDISNLGTTSGMGQVDRTHMGVIRPSGGSPGRAKRASRVRKCLIQCALANYQLSRTGREQASSTALRNPSGRRYFCPNGQPNTTASRHCVERLQRRSVA